MATLELNIKAKKKTPPPPVGGAMLTLPLEVGKIYVDGRGKRVLGVEITASATRFRGRYEMEDGTFTSTPYVWVLGSGLYVGLEDIPESNRHLVCEWFESYPFYKAWLAGKKIKATSNNSGTRVTLGAHVDVVKAFGSTSTTTKGWWKDRNVTFFKDFEIVE